MANVTDSNPISIDTAAAIWAKTPKYIRQIQWIDDAADIADDDDLVIVVNGVTITTKIQIANTAGATPVEAVTPNIGNICVWEIGPFNPGIAVHSFAVTTIDHGVLLVWID